MKLKMIILYSIAIIPFIYLCVPVVFRYSPFIQRGLLFMNNFKRETVANLSKPEEQDIKCARTLLLQNFNDPQLIKYGLDKVELGVWHIIPESSLKHCFVRLEDNRTLIEDEQAFVGSRPIVLYLHGNAGTRAGIDRIRLYKRLAYQHDYHIVTFDYRGFADSTYIQPSSDGLVADAIFMYRWLLKQPAVTKERLIIWGHSLGTAVAVRMVSELALELQPSKLILEAPFDSVANAIANHKWTVPFRIMPYFKYFFVNPIEQSSELNFDSTSKIILIRSTMIMILHAEDDSIIPFKLGRNLYEKGKEVLGELQIRFSKIDAIHKCGHNQISTHDETMNRVKEFVGGLQALS